MILRAPRAAAAWFRDRDPNTAVSEAYIRRLIINGDIPCIKNGCKQLVDCEQIERYIADRLRG